MSEASRLNRATGLTMFAGVAMVVVGLLDILQGITAIAKDSIYLHTPHYAYTFDTTSWGWIHLVIGALVFVVGVGVLVGTPVARIIGILIVAVGLITNFLYIPYYPFWAIVLIALDFFVIWALIVSSTEDHA